MLFSLIGIAVLSFVCGFIGVTWEPFRLVYSMGLAVTAAWLWKNKSRVGKSALADELEGLVRKKTRGEFRVWCSGFDDSESIIALAEAVLTALRKQPDLKMKFLVTSGRPEKLRDASQEMKDGRPDLYHLLHFAPLDILNPSPWPFKHKFDYIHFNGEGLEADSIEIEKLNSRLESSLGETGWISGMALRK